VPRDRLLIVDDDAMVAETVRRLAAACDYDAEATTTPQAFLARIEAWRPTHIAVDLQMPEMDGVELLRRLADAGCGAKVIVMTGAAGKVLEAARRLAAQRGLAVAGALHKPFRAAELRDLLEQARTAIQPLSEAELAQAMTAGELFLDYQPKVGLRDGRLVGLEALVRWRRAGVVVAPAEFIPLAERTGLIRELGRHLVERTLDDLLKWPPLPQGARIAINLSAIELDDLALADRLAEQCARVGVSPDRISFEVTESAAIGDAIKSVDVLTRLRLKGFDLALDDFGTGHSSLVQLQRLPVSEIKVDQSFVRECTASAGAKAIVRATVDLARNLGLSCTAEGVEDAQTLALLVEVGCEQAQGYYIARPLPAAAVPDWIARNIPFTGVQGLAGPDSRNAARGDPWLKRYDGSEEVRAQLQDALTRAVNPLWDLGRNSLIGWRANGKELEALMCPYGRIVDCFPQSRRLLQGRRQMGDRTFEEAQRLTGAELHRIVLPFAVGEGAGEAPAVEVEQALRRYGITETLHRGVALFDIAGFSRQPPMLQVAQLNSLECSLNSAHKVMREMGVEIDLARTTTGDGFYVWNRRKGFAADVATYLLTLVALADNAVARLDNASQRAPEVRVCFSVGPHYSYYQVEGLDPRGHDYIVGDVTIALARMSAKCLPGQILIGEFESPAESERSVVGVLEFVALAARELEKLRDVELRGRRVDDLRCYLTGRETAEGAFSLSRFLVRDKHGGSHAAFNQKFNLYVSPAGRKNGSAPLFLGLQRESLGAFDAERAELEWSPPRPANP